VVVKAEVPGAVPTQVSVKEPTASYPSAHWYVHVEPRATVEVQPTFVVLATGVYGLQDTGLQAREKAAVTTASAPPALQLRVVLPTAWYPLLHAKKQLPAVATPVHVPLV